MKTAVNRLLAQTTLLTRLASMRVLSAAASNGQKSTMATLTDPSPVMPKRPSPYRLFTPTTFLASFADLHVAGWRLLPLASSPTSGQISQTTGDLQDRRLVRVYEFQADQSEKSWRVDLDKLVSSIIKHGADTRVGCHCWKEHTS